LSEVDPCVSVGDEFGASLAPATSTATPSTDLAIGAPSGCIANPFVSDAGEVFVAHGSAGRPARARRLRHLRRNSAGIFGDAADGERFGGAVKRGRLRRRRARRPRHRRAERGDNGALYVVMGSPFGLIFVNSVFLGTRVRSSRAGGRGPARLRARRRRLRPATGTTTWPIGDPGRGPGAANELVDAGSISVRLRLTCLGSTCRGPTSFTQGRVYADAAADEPAIGSAGALRARDFRRRRPRGSGGRVHPGETCRRPWTNGAA